MLGVTMLSLVILSVVSQTKLTSIFLRASSFAFLSAVMLSVIVASVFRLVSIVIVVIFSEEERERE
jgi:hypothetical protein